MLSIPLILAAGSLFTLISGAPVPSFPLGSVTDVTTSAPSLRERGAFVYVTYGGDGSTADGWPSMNQWISSFDTMFNNNKQIMSNACTQFNVPNNSDNEINELHDSILSVASSTGVDARYILAILLQESNGCLRVPTTNGGVRNPGIMQDHNGSGTCNDNGVVSNPCPSSEITQMIQDGTAGTSSGDGLKQCLAKAGTSSVAQYYIAARIYNSGSVDSSGNLGLGVATHCYASDVANRLTGWDAGTSGCSPGTVGQLTTTVGAPSSPSTPDTPASPPAASSPAAAASTAAAVVPPPASNPAASIPSSSAIVAAAPASSPSPASAPAAAAPVPGSDSTPVVVTITSIINPGATSAPQAAAAPPADSNPAPVVVTVTSIVNAVPAATASPVAGGAFLQTGSGSGSGSSSSVSSAPAASTSTPTAPAAGVPLYPYTIAGCQEYYTVVAGDYCILVEQKFGITPSQLESWNTGLDDSCSNLWLGYQYCVKA